MAKKDVEDIVCRAFCSFYREGVKEDLICHGAAMLESLMGKGILSPGAITQLKGRLSPSPGEYDGLEEAVCAPCPFLAEDCDFRSQSPPPGAEPCGGLILLALLVRTGAVPIEKLEELDRE